MHTVNPLAKKTLDEHGIVPSKVYVSRLLLLKEIRRDILKQVHAASEALFKRKPGKGEIAFRPMKTSDERLNRELAEALTINVRDDEKTFHNRNGEMPERSLYEKIYEGISTQCATVADTMDLQGDRDMRRIEHAFLR